MQTTDYKWFLDNFSDLYKQFGTKYLVIKNKTVLGTYDTYADGVKDTLKREKIGTFIVQKCDKDESAYTNYISSMRFTD